MTARSRPGMMEVEMAKDLDAAKTKNPGEPIHGIRAWSGPNHPNETPFCGVDQNAARRTMFRNVVTCEVCAEHPAYESMPEYTGDT